MRRAAYLVAASALVPGVAAASAPTITIACFGSDLALSAKSDVDGVVHLAAEVLSLGDGRVAPSGTVVFLVDNRPVGPADGVPLKPGRDPRTGQAAGLAWISVPVANGLHLAPGGHTVTARFIPAGNAALEPSLSSAANNLRISGAAVASVPAPAPALGTLPPLAPEEANLTPPLAPVTSPQTAALSAPPPPLPSDRFWVSIEENVLQISGDISPSRLVNNFDPIVSGGSVSLGPVPTSPGFIGLSAFLESVVPTPTGSVFGGPTDTGVHNGQTISAGYWLDPGKLAIDGEFFFLDPTSHSDFKSPNGGNLAVQVLNPGGGYSNYIISETPITATSSSYINTTPAVFVHLFDDSITTSASGSVAINSSTDFLSPDLKYRMRLWDNGAGSSLDFTAGLRYADLSELMSIGTSVNGSSTETVTYDPALGLPGTPNYTNTTASLVTTADTFSTHNRFLGPQVGLSGKYEWGQLWLSGDAKVALGPMFEALHISGSTNATTTSSITPTTTILLAGIPLAVASGAPVVTTTSSSSNVGLFKRSGHWGDLVFAALPSADIKLGYDIVPDVLSLTAGYSAMFLSSVARPGNQVNRNLGSLAQTGFWAQGVTVGVKYRFD